MSTTPQVRVRLSADGVQEVVNALKQVQAQAQGTGNAAKTAGSGFGALAAGADGAQKAIKLLAAAYAGLQVAAFTRHAYDQAAAFQRLSEKTGTTVEDLSRLWYAASQSGMKFEQFFDAIEEANQRMGEAAEGTGEAAEAFQAMGVSVKDANGNTRPLMSTLRDIADRFKAYKASGNEAALGAAVFSDGGKELVRVLNDGRKGLDDMAKASDEAGTTLSTKAAKDASEFSKTISQLGVRLIALTQDGLGPVLSSLNEFVKRVVAARGAGDGWARSLAAGFGGFSSIAEAEAEVARLDAAVNGSKTVIGAWWAEGYKPALAQAKRQLEELRKAEAARLQDAKEAAEAEALARAMTAAGTAGAGADGKDTTNAPALNAAVMARDLAKAKADAERAAAAQELAKVKAELALQSEKYAQNYSKNLFSLKTYHAARLAIVEAENKAELKAAQDAVTAAQSLQALNQLDQQAKDTAIQAANAALLQAQLAGELKLAQARGQQREELKQLSDEMRQARIQDLEQTGRQHEAAMLALEAEIQKRKELLIQNGTSLEQIEAETAALRARGTARADFDKLQRATTDDKRIKSLDARQAGVEDAQARGDIGQLQAESQLLSIERERAAVLAEIASQMLAAAQASQDPTLIKQAEDYTRSIQQMKLASDEYAATRKSMAEGIENSLNNGLNDMFDSIIDSSKSAGEAVRGFAFSFIDSLRKMAQEVLMRQAVMSIMNMFGGGGGATTPAAATVKAATGGYIEGPGSGTSDSIPAWLSNGEFVVRSAVVAQPGMLAALHEINRGGRLPGLRAQRSHPAVARFADGGLVGAGGSNSSQGGNSSLTVGLDSGLVLKELQTPAGQRVLVELLGKNSRAVKRVIT